MNENFRSGHNRPAFAYNYKYIDIDEKAIDVRLTNQQNDDGTNGAPALYANIPIVNIKSDMKVDSEEDIIVEEVKEETEIKPEEVKEEKKSTKSSSKSNKSNKKN